MPRACGREDGEGAAASAVATVYGFPRDAQLQQGNLAAYSRHGGCIWRGDLHSAQWSQLRTLA